MVVCYQRHCVVFTLKLLGQVDLTFKSINLNYSLNLVNLYLVVTAMFTMQSASSHRYVLP